MDLIRSRIERDEARLRSREALIREAQTLAERKMNNTEIAKKLNINESDVRALLIEKV